MCTRAAPSIILTSTFGMDSGCVLLCPHIPINLICSFGALFHLMPMMGPGMNFMNKEGIPVTFPRLACYIHTGEQLDIILKIGNLRDGI